MSAVTEEITREFFEALGFCVMQPRKSVASRKPKRLIEEIDLIVLNPRATEHHLPERFVWESDDLRGIRSAVVGVLGWHTDRLYASTFEQMPELLRFVEPGVMRAAERALGTDKVAKVLCLPRLAASGDLKTKSIDALKAKGIDGVISFRTVLAELVLHVDTKKNYDKSSILQVIRLLKNYDFLKDNQLDLFGKRGRRGA